MEHFFFSFLGGEGAAAYFFSAPFLCLLYSDLFLGFPTYSFPDTPNLWFYLQEKFSMVSQNFWSP